MARPRPQSLRPDPSFERLASREPLYAVFPKPAHRASALTDDTRAAFYASGEALVGALARTIELSLAPHFEPTRILDYGCGPGRLSLPLARLAARTDGTVTAVDRSPAMLDALAREMAARGVTNLTPVQAPDFWQQETRFDCIVCYLVLQRLSRTDAVELVQALLSRLLPGGIVVVQFPYRSRASRPARALRRARTHVPGVNAIVNRTRGAASDDPFLPTECHDTAEILQLFRDEHFAGTHVTFDDHGDLDSVIVSGEAPMTTAAAMSRQPSIDVATVIRETSIDVLNRDAEQYYASLTNWDHHLAKPLASADEAPWLLSNTATLLQGLELSPGLSVLEYGAGTGWLSRMFTQLGCRTILLDVSPTAHAIARELYARQPPIGSQPSPEFLAFDGRRIDLTDASVDRVVCFHAFHHAPNPDLMIAEFARILRPGGRAVFAEPGPRHSETPQSQFEMQNYQVVENDVRVHDLWKVAQTAGFTDLRMMASNGLPFHVSLADYDDLLRGGPTADAWTAATRVFLRNVRNFVLVKGGTVIDSRAATGLACQMRAVTAGPPDDDGALPVRVTITNSGTARWLQSPGTHGHVSLGLRTFDGSGALASADVLPEPLVEPVRPIEPGETLHVTVRVPRTSLEGRRALEFDCVAAGVTWFAQVGGRPARIDL